MKRQADKQTRNNSSKAEKKSINLSIYWFSCFKIVKMIFWKNKQTNEKRICYKNPLEMKILCFQMFKCHNFLTIIIILNGTTIITLICGFLKINNTTRLLYFCPISHRRKMKKWKKAKDFNVNKKSLKKYYKIFMFIIFIMMMIIQCYNRHYNIVYVQVCPTTNKTKQWFSMIISITSIDRSIDDDIDLFIVNWIELKIFKLASTTSSVISIIIIDFFLTNFKNLERKLLLFLLLNYMTLILLFYFFIVKSLILPLLLTTNFFFFDIVHWLIIHAKIMLCFMWM